MHTKIYSETLMERPLGKSKYRWNAIIEINLRKQGWKGKYNSHGSEQGPVIITTLPSSTLQCN
jgi:hypothetical protein